MPYNSTIVIREKICSVCGKKSVIFSRGRCKTCATIQSVAARQEKEIISEGLQDLIKEADAIFSRFIRMKAADANGEAKCFTCGHKARWQEMQNGHFISRSCLYLRLDTRNCRVQCVDCNEFKQGNISEYRKRLEKERPGITEILEEESRIVFKYTISDLKALILEYSQKVIELQKKFKNKS